MTTQLRTADAVGHPLSALQVSVSQSNERGSGFSGESIASLSRQLGEGKASASSLVQRALDRISEANPQSGAVIETCPERAQRQANALDDLSEIKRRELPLFGIPFTVKDNISVAGLRRTAGSAAFSTDAPQTESAWIVSRLERAGAVVVGRANMSEFALGAAGDSSGWGAVTRVGFPDLLSGGSSGGSAASVAGGMVPFSLGTDTGGSVRIPAALCGVVGFKLNYDPQFLDGIFPLSGSLDHLGLIAATVSDIVTLFHSVVGGGPPPPPAEDRILERVAGNFDGLRVGVLDRLVGHIADPALSNAVRNSARRLSAAGAHTVEIPGARIVEIAELQREVFLSEVAELYGQRIAARRAGISAESRARFASVVATRPSGSSSAPARLAQLRLHCPFEAWGVDALLLPAVHRTSWNIRERGEPESERSMSESAAFSRFTTFVNATGQPALTVPLSSPARRESLSVQLVGCRGSEPILFAMAAHLRAE